MSHQIQLLVLSG